MVLGGVLPASATATYRLFSQILQLMTTPHSEIFQKFTQQPKVNCSYQPLNSGDVGMWFTLPGLLVPLGLSFLMRRKNACLHLCRGRPGVAIPMNAIEMRHIRLPYLIAFGATIPSILSILTSTSLPFYDANFPVWAKMVLKILVVCIYGTVWYPLFAAISSQMIVGYIIGLLYAIAHLVVAIYSEVACINVVAGNANRTLLMFVRQGPTIIFLTALIFYFPIVLFMHLRSPRHPAQRARDKENQLMGDYVRQKLGLKPKKPSTSRVLKKLREIGVLGPECFVFPPRLLCSLLISFLVLYTFIIELYGYIVPVIEIFMKYVATYHKDDKRTKKEVVAAIMKYDPNHPSTLTSLVLDAARVLHFALSVLRVCFIISVTLSAIFSGFHFPHILINYRRHVLSAYKGEYPIVRSSERITSISALSGFMRLMGYQAAYLCWGFLIQVALLLLVSFSTAFILVIPLIYGFGQIWITLISDYWPIPMTTAIFLIVQYLVTRFVFLKKPGIAIHNRHVFFVWTYYLFFYDIFLGAVSCIARVLTTLGLGFIFIGRIDMPVTPRLFEFLDPGFNIYSGFVLTEVAHNHPILRVFVNMLLEEKERISTPNSRRSLRAVEPMVVAVSCNGDHLDSAKAEAKALRGHRARLRWHLLYTLLNNEEIHCYRKHRMDQHQQWLESKMNGYRQEESGGLNAPVMETEESFPCPEDEEAPPVTCPENKKAPLPCPEVEEETTVLCFEVKEAPPKPFLESEAPLPSPEEEEVEEEEEDRL